MTFSNKSKMLLKITLGQQFVETPKGRQEILLVVPFLQNFIDPYTHHYKRMQKILQKSDHSILYGFLKAKGRNFCQSAKKVHCASVKPNRDEIFHTVFQLLLANLLNHQHLITKLCIEQLVAVVAEMRWLRLGDRQSLHVLCYLGSYLLQQHLLGQYVFFGKAPPAPTTHTLFGQQHKCASQSAKHVPDHMRKDTSRGSPTFGAVC